MSFPYYSLIVVGVLSCCDGSSNLLQSHLSKIPGPPNKEVSSKSKTDHWATFTILSWHEKKEK